MFYNTTDFKDTRKKHVLNDFYCLHDGESIEVPQANFINSVSTVLT